MLTTLTAEPLAAGASDLEAAATALASRLPAPLQPLTELAYNYRWSWAGGGPDLFAAIDPTRWAHTHMNPVRLLQEVPPWRLAALAADEAFLADLHELHAAVAADLARPYAESTVTASRPAAFFCAEYAVHQSPSRSFLRQAWTPIVNGELGSMARPQLTV